MFTAGELRVELAKRGLPTDGTKPVLEARLRKALEVEVPLACVKRGREEQVAVDEFRCACCVEIILPPITQCRDGHLICADCLERLPKPRRCPTCRVDLSASSRNRALERIAEDLLFPCSNARCGKRLRYTELANHRTTCDFQSFGCPFRSCQWNGDYDQLGSHFQERHPKSFESRPASNYPYQVSLPVDDVAHHYYTEKGQLSYVVSVRGTKRRPGMAIQVYYVGKTSDAATRTWCIDFSSPTLSLRASGPMVPCQHLRYSSPDSIYHVFVPQYILESLKYETKGKEKVGASQRKRRIKCTMTLS